jgi:dihydroorotase-like cyclic amidohydrolase
VRFAVTNPAKIIGIYPRKGIIQIGSDADFAIVDMKKERTFTDEGLYTKVGWSPFEGKKVKGVPVMTIRRGEVIMDGGEVTGKPGSGKFLAPLSTPKGP